MSIVSTSRKPCNRHNSEKERYMHIHMMSNTSQDTHVTACIQKDTFAMFMHVVQHVMSRAHGMVQYHVWASMLV
jgi:hypothetical protein